MNSKTTTAETSVLDPRPTDGNGHDGHSAHGGHDEDAIDVHPPHPRPFWVVLMAGVAVLGLVALLLTGLIPRQRNARELNADAADAANAPVPVNVVRPRRAPPAVNVTLPGTLRPWQEVSIFSRTTGYLKKYFVDISQEVTFGQPMAEIESPEIDEELGQAKAALLQTQAAVIRATADRDLAASTLKRFQVLKETQSVAPQTLDEKQSALDVAESVIASAKANVAATEANVRRLTEMQSFEKVAAPFAGVVTGRAYDVGSLILANPTNIDVKPMFKIAQNDVLRAFVNVPQSAALQIKKGMTVQVTARERPGRVFAGTVMGTTNYLDPANRSLLTEVKLTNPREPDGTFALLPGMYVQAAFSVTRDAPPLLIPGPALVSNADGTRVAVVDRGTVHFKTVTLGQDFGSEVEVAGGLTGDEQIIANPGERIVEGVAVSTTGEPAEQHAGPGNAAPTVKVSEATK